MHKRTDSSGRIIPASKAKYKGFFQFSSNYFSSFLLSLRRLFYGCADFSCEWRQLGSFSLPVCRFEGLCSGSEVSDFILRPLSALHCTSPQLLYAQLCGGSLWAMGMEERTTAEELAEDLLQGRCVLLLPFAALSFDTRSQTSRSVEEPVLERSLLGPRDSFTEHYRTNTALLRSHLRTSALKLTEVSVGTASSCRVGIVFLAGHGGEDYAKSICRTLRSAPVAAVTSLGDLEALLVPSHRGAFPQFHATERPDRMARHLLEGRVGILCDGLPCALLAPCTLPELMRVAEDRSSHALSASVLLMLRWMALLLALLLPALYLSVALYHQELLPFELLQSIIEAKQQVPFTTAAEILGMLGAFALLQEAGYRLPEGAGSSVSIIGSLIVGQSAVDARVVSPIAVIVVAISGIAGYTLPDRSLEAALRLWRFLLVLCALCLGIYGVMGGFLLLLWQLCGMENQGVSYLYPLCDGERRYRNTFLRMPLRRKRP